MSGRFAQVPGIEGPLETQRTPWAQAAGTFSTSPDTGIAAIRSNPLVATVEITGFATAFGLFAGGLVTLRPDHDPHNLRVMEEVGKGRHAVLVHPIRHSDAARAAELLEEASGEVIRTL